MMKFESWPEPIVRVQSLSQSRITTIPDRYIKPLSKRPSNLLVHDDPTINIPVIDMQALIGDNQSLRETTLQAVETACREWGFFQVVNHGVSHELMKRARDTWREFFELPLDVKQEYSNDPSTYEGYGSRLGVEKGAILDWSDYFFLHYLPKTIRKPSKWPALPSSCRDLIEEYSKESTKLCGRLMRVLAKNLGLEEEHLLDAFGGEDNVGVCLRVNFYPRCPQPDLTLGISPHSDPGCMTLLLPDDDVAGLQVLKGDDTWVTVKPVPNAFIVNMGDQMQVLSNAIYKSVEHRVIVNSVKDRVSLAMFYNPKSDLPIQPAEALVTADRPALYPAMTFDEYRLYIRTKGLCGKSQVKSLKTEE